MDDILRFPINKVAVLSKLNKRNVYLSNVRTKIITSIAQTLPLPTMKHIIEVLENFIPSSQLSVLIDNIDSEEGEFFQQKFIELYATITAMPKTYESDGRGENAIVYLHYFVGGSDFYVTERDIYKEQYQAFGYSKLAQMGEGELGYISIHELIGIKWVELDLYWEQVPLHEITQSLM